MVLCVLLFVAIFTGVFLYHHGINHNDQLSQDGRTFYKLNEMVVVSLYYSIVPSVFISLFILLVFTHSHPGNIVISFWLPVVVSSVILVVSYGGYLNDIRASKVMPFENRFVIKRGRLNHMKDNMLYFDNTVQERMRNVYIAEFESGYSHNYYDSVDKQSSTITAAEEVLQFGSNEKNPHFRRIFSAGTIIDFVFNDFNRVLQHMFLSDMSGKQDFTIFLFGNILFIMSLMIFFHVSDWPLFNVIAALLIFHGFFELQRVWNFSGFDNWILAYSPFTRYKTAGFLLGGVGLLFFVFQFVASITKKSSRRRGRRGRAV